MIRQYRPYAGRTTLGVCVANNTVARQTKEFMKAVSYRGALDIGYRYSERTGQYKMIDVNPRIGATFRLLVDTNGMDVARALYLDLTDQPIVPGRLREGRKWVVEDLDIFAWPTYRRNEKLSVWDWLCSYRGVEEAMWFASDDLVPFIAMGWRLIRQLCKKLTTVFALGR
jgi:predicted ATP-grasp superfamily ATP-dependent carboligase